MQILSRAKRYGPNTPTFFPPNPPFFPQSVLGFPRQIVVVYSVPTQINFTGFIKLILDLKNGGTFTGPNQSGSFDALGNFIAQDYVPGSYNYIWTYTVGTVMNGYEAWLAPAAPLSGNGYGLFVNFYGFSIGCQGSALWGTTPPIAPVRGPLLPLEFSGLGYTTLNIPTYWNVGVDPQANGNFWSVPIFNPVGNESAILQSVQGSLYLTPIIPPNI